ITKPWLSRANREDPEYVVVAGGSVVVGDDGEGVEAYESAGREIDTGTFAEAGAAAVAGRPAGGLVVGDHAPLDREGCRGAGVRWRDREAIVEDATAEAVAAVGAGASLAAEG